jgi:hypothetical protein
MVPNHAARLRLPRPVAGLRYQIERRFLCDQTEALLQGDELSRSSRAAMVAVVGRPCNSTHRAPHDTLASTRW